MAVLDMEALTAETVEASEEEVYAHLDALCRELLGMTADEFVGALAVGTRFEQPAAARLEVLARAFI